MKAARLSLGVLQIITLQLCCNESLIINTLLNAKTQQFSSVFGTSHNLNLGQLLGKPLDPSDRSIFMPPFSIVSYKLLNSVAWIPNDACCIFSRLIWTLPCCCALTAVAVGIALAGIAPITVVAVFAGLKIHAWSRFMPQAQAPLFRAC